MSMCEKILVVTGDAGESYEALYATLNIAHAQPAEQDEGQSVNLTVIAHAPLDLATVSVKVDSNRAPPATLASMLPFLSEANLQGRAIDVRLTGVETSRLCDVALALKLGGVGYYMATGNTVFSGETSGEVLSKQLNEAPVPLSKHLHGAFPEDLERLLMQ